MIICMRSEDYKNKCIVKQKKKQTLNAVYNHIMWLSDDIKIKKEIPWIIKWVNILKFYSQKTSVKITQI